MQEIKERQLTFFISSPTEDKPGGAMVDVSYFLPWTPDSWINRRYHPTAEAALAEARIVFPFLNKIIYIVEHELDEACQEHWPHSTNWRTTTTPPYYGKVQGAFYYPRPNFYIVRSDGEQFVPAEDTEEARRKKAAAWESFHIRHPEISKDHGY
jgi:hypothetical protein